MHRSWNDVVWSFNSMVESWFNNLSSLIIDSLLKIPFCGLLVQCDRKLIIESTTDPTHVMSDAAVCKLGG